MVFSTKTIHIFKNGTAFLVKSAKVKPTTTQTQNINDNTPTTGPRSHQHVRIEDNDVPQAKFGTLWFTCDPIGTSTGSTKLVSVKSRVDTVTQQKKAVTIPEMMRANVGKQVHIWLTTINGDSDANRLAPATIQCVEDGLIQIITTEDGMWHALQPTDIARVAFLHGPPHQKLEKSELQRILDLEFESNTAEVASGGSNDTDEVEVHLMYLCDNFGWLPNYSIDIITTPEGKDDKAIISLQAISMNDAEDFDCADLHFCVGSPNFLYTSLLSPICGSGGDNGENDGGNIPKFLKDLYNCQQNQGVLTHTRQYDTGEGYSTIRESTATPIVGEDRGAMTAGSEQEDLFYYTAKNVCMKKNERASVLLFKGESPVEHFYQVNLKTKREPTNNGIYHFSDNNEDKVYHYIKLRNKSGIDWTTGTAMVTTRKTANFGETKPISQDMMNFTPRNGEAKLKLAVSPDIIVQCAELETSRKKCAEKTNNSNSYCTLVKITGQIQMTNFKKKAVTLRVLREIVGELEVDKGNTARSEVSRKINHRSSTSHDVCWQYRLEPGEKKIVEYHYSKHELVYK